MNIEFWIVYALIGVVCAAFGWAECRTKKQHWTYKLWWPFKLLAMIVVGLLWFPIMLKAVVGFLLGGSFGR